MGDRGKLAVINAFKTKIRLFPNNLAQVEQTWKANYEAGTELILNSVLPNVEVSSLTILSDKVYSKSITLQNDTYREGGDSDDFNRMLQMPIKIYRTDVAKELDASDKKAFKSNPFLNGYLYSVNHRSITVETEEKTYVNFPREVFTLGKMFYSSPFPNSPFFLVALSGFVIDRASKEESFKPLKDSDPIEIKLSYVVSSLSFEFVHDITVGSYGATKARWQTSARVSFGGKSVMELPRKSVDIVFTDQEYQNNNASSRSLSNNRNTTTEQRAYYKGTGSMSTMAVKDLSASEDTDFGEAEMVVENTQQSPGKQVSNGGKAHSKSSQKDQKALSALPQRKINARSENKQGTYGSHFLVAEIGSVLNNGQHLVDLDNGKNKYIDCSVSLIVDCAKMGNVAKNYKPMRVLKINTQGEINSSEKVYSISSDSANGSPSSSSSSPSSSNTVGSQSGLGAYESLKRKLVPGSVNVWMRNSDDRNLVRGGMVNNGNSAVAVSDRFGDIQMGETRLTKDAKKYAVYYLECSKEDSVSVSITETGRTVVYETKKEAASSNNQKKSYAKKKRDKIAIQYEVCIDRREGDTLPMTLELVFSTNDAKIELRMDEGSGEEKSNVTSSPVLVSNYYPRVEDNEKLITVEIQLLPGSLESQKVHFSILERKNN